MLTGIKSQVIVAPNGDYFNLFEVSITADFEQVGDQVKVQFTNVTSRALSSDELIEFYRNQKR